MQAGSLSEDRSQAKPGIATEQSSSEEPVLTTHQTSDEVLIQRAFERNPQEGLSMLFVRYYTPLCSHAVRYVSSKAVAEDIVAEVFVQFQSRQAYQTIQTSYRSYLYGSVRNLALRYLRDEVTMLSDTSLSAQNAPEDQPSAQLLLEADEIRWHLQMAIEELSLPLQRVFIACRIEGKKQALVASELGLSVKTVEVYVARALQQVRQHMKKAGLLVLTLFFNAL